MKEEKLEARLEENRKVVNLRRSGDPVVLQSHGGSDDAGLAVVVRFPEHQARNTRRHNHATRCVDQPCRFAALWPVLWILARCHPRRIWCGKSLSNVDNFKASLNIFANRIRWRWFFSRHTETAVFYLCPIPRQNQCVHPSWCSFSRHVDLKFKTLPH